MAAVWDTIKKTKQVVGAHDNLLRGAFILLRNISFVLVSALSKRSDNLLYNWYTSITEYFLFDMRL